MSKHTMMRHRRFPTHALWSAIVILVLAPAALRAQDAPGADPFPGGAAPPAKGVAREGAPVKAQPEYVPNDPIDTVLSGLDLHKPENLLFALDIYLNLQRNADAKRTLKALIDAKLPPAALVKLQQEKGSSLFVRLVNSPELQPEGGRFGNLVLNAAYAEAHDAKRLEGLLNQLGDPSPEKRAIAHAELRAGDTTAVQVLLHALREENNAAKKKQLKIALALMGTAALEPLLGAMAASDADFQRDVIEVLGALKNVRAVPFLLRPALDEKGSPELRAAALEALTTIVGRPPQRNDGVVLLTRDVENYFAGQLPSRPDFEGQIVFWQWDPKGKQVLPYKLLADDAAKVVAAQLARDLYALAPESLGVRRLYLLTNLEAEKIIAGLGAPLPRTPGSAFSLASAAGVAAVEDALAVAMEKGHAPAAMGAAEVLGNTKDLSVIASTDGRPRPLVAALRHGDRRLRYFAAAAVNEIDPKQAYPGASYFPEALAFFAGTSGERRVLVGHPRPEEAQTIVGLLNELGFEASAAYTGKQLFQLAVDEPDCEFILLSDALERFDDNETVQQLRRDPRTARLPIGIMAREENLQAAQHFAEQDPLLAAFPMPKEPKAMAREMRTLVALAGRYSITREERLAEATAALDWLIRLTANKNEHMFYDLLAHEAAIEAALYVPALTEKAATLLSQIGSPTAQRALVDVASQGAYPLVQREAAAAAFRAAVKARGLLLTTDQIEQQYARYNQSATADKDSQKVLGELLDTIELTYNRTHKKK